MSSLFNTLMFAAGLLVGCSVPTSQQPEASISKAPSTVVDKPSDCDFSSYAAVRMEQFDRDAIIKRVQPEYPSEAVQRGVQRSRVSEGSC
jgi:PBP1b-binding outer membrane lipoprotein LpoB